jgi:hypothetical protein
MNEELNMYMNIGMRYLTGKYGTKLTLPEGLVVDKEEAMAKANEPLPERVLPETNVPKLAEGPPKLIDASLEDLEALGAVASADGGDEEQAEKEASAAVVVSAPALVASASPSVLVGAPTTMAFPVQTASVVSFAPTSGIQIGELEEGPAFPEAEEVGVGVRPPPMQSAAAPQVTFAPSGPMYMMSQPGMAFTQQQFQMPQTAFAPGQSMAFAAPSAPGIFQVGAPVTQLLPAGMGTAPSTLVVDTGPDAMASAGLPALAAKRTAPGSKGPVVVRSKTAARPAATAAPASSGAAASQGGPVPPQVRVNIIKQGSK